MKKFTQEEAQKMFNLLEEQINNGIINEDNPDFEEIEKVLEKKDEEEELPTHNFRFEDFKVDNSDDAFYEFTCETKKEYYAKKYEWNLKALYVCKKTKWRFASMQNAKGDIKYYTVVSNDDIMADTIREVLDWMSERYFE